MKNTDRTASTTQDFLPSTPDERYHRITQVDQVSRGLAIAMGLGLMFWLVLAIIIFSVKSL